MLENIQKNLTNKSIFHSTDSIENLPTIIGYEKLFKWRWVATQLNTFIVAVDHGDTVITEEHIENVLAQSFDYASKNYTGWPRGFQSGIGVISILISSQLDDQAIAYCEEIKSGKKWAGFSIPVVLNSATNETHYFKKNPLWGRIYFPHFKELIDQLTG